MKTILIMIVLSLSNPDGPALMVHKSYPTMAACEAASNELKKAITEEPDVKGILYCVEASDLTE